MIYLDLLGRTAKGEYRMKKIALSLVLMAGISACASYEATEDSTASSVEDAKSIELPEECDPADPDCDHTGAAHKPPPD